MTTTNRDLCEAYNLIPSFIREAIEQALSDIKAKHTLTENQEDWLLIASVFVYNETVKTFWQNVSKEVRQHIDFFGVNEETLRAIGQEVRHRLALMCSEEELEAMKDVDTKTKDLTGQKAQALVFAAAWKGGHKASKISSLAYGGKACSTQDIEREVRHLLNGDSPKFYLPGGKGMEAIVQACTLSYRERGFQGSDTLIFNRGHREFEKEIVGGSLREEGEVIVTIRDKSHKNPSELSFKQSVAPVNKHTYSLVIWFFSKLKDYYNFNAKTYTPMGVTIDEVVGEGKLFAQKRDAVEPFREMYRLLDDFRWISYYDSKTSKGRNYQMSTFGRVDSRTVARVPSKIFNLVQFSDYPIEEAFAVEPTKDIGQDLSTIVHKFFLAPTAFFTDYSDLERMLVWSLHNEWSKGGKPRTNEKTIPGETLLDWFGYVVHSNGEESKPFKVKRPKRILDEIVSTFESIKRKDKGETFSSLELSFDSTQKQPLNRLRTLSIKYTQKPQ